MQIAVLEEQKIDGAENEDVDKVEDKAKLINADPSGGLDEKPDINDVPVEENQVFPIYSMFLRIFFCVFKGLYVTTVTVWYMAYIN